ncbi:YxeA family protein [Bacillus cytotoxicus]|uniref:YxeA family protein n=1 Tax=Bacillus cereus group sp. BfR-BA-01492 TaxID=2920361 RepID=UPI001F57BBFC|nr:YxeA family protein [Bacillus cereus group sp. BfR-BA-01492]EMA6345045.1 YxeA family protein [Bacillus cytotoxicus]
MQKLLVISVLFVLFSSFAIGCERSPTINRMGTEQYYVQITNNGEVKGNQRFYTLPTYNKDGVEKTVTFGSVKPKNKPLKENAFIRLYIDQKDNNNTEINHKEIKSYEEVQKDDLPSKVKERFHIK